MQNILLALRVVSETGDTEKHTQMASQMLRYLVARPDIPLTGQRVSGCLDNKMLDCVEDATR